MKNNQNPPQYEWGPFPFGDGAFVLDIRYDPVFKAVFTKDTPESKGALSDLISALIGRSITVETIAANEPPSGFLGQKKIRFDIACIGKNGEPIDVEMSFHPIDDELNRIEYFASRLFVGQDIKGVEKNYSDLKETYQISILAQKRFFPDKNLIHTFLFYDPFTHVSLDGKIRIITLELEKSAQFLGKPAREMKGAEAWAVYFRYLTDEAKREKIKEIIDCEEGIAMATNALSQVAANFDEYALQTTILKSELDWQASMVGAKREGLKEGFDKGLTKGIAKGIAQGLAKGRDEGIAQGLTKGRNEANLENARKMKAMGFLTEQIQDITGLSAETIANIPAIK